MAACRGNDSGAGMRRQSHRIGTHCGGAASSITRDKEALVSIVKEMSESMTGAQSTTHWAEDGLWFDIPPFALKGVQPALNFFDKVFSSSSLARWTSSTRKSS